MFKNSRFCFLGLRKCFYNLRVQKTSKVNFVALKIENFRAFLIAYGKIKMTDLNFKQLCEVTEHFKYPNFSPAVDVPPSNSE